MVAKARAQDAAMATQHAATRSQINALAGQLEAQAVRIRDLESALEPGSGIGYDGTSAANAGMAGGYALPTECEILPYVLLSPAAQQMVDHAALPLVSRSNEHHSFMSFVRDCLLPAASFTRRARAAREPGDPPKVYTMTSGDVLKWAIYAAISRQQANEALQIISGFPFVLPEPDVRTNQVGMTLFPSVGYTPEQPNDDEDSLNPLKDRPEALEAETGQQAKEAPEAYTTALPFDAVWQGDSSTAGCAEEVRRAHVDASNLFAPSHPYVPVGATMPPYSRFPGSNAPQHVRVPFPGSSRSDVLFSWLGCRCSWPVTQLCWYTCIACNIHQGLAVFVATFTQVWIATFLESFVVQDFIMAVPDAYNQGTWIHLLSDDTPSVLRVAKVLTYVSLPFWVIGFIMWGDGLGQYGNKYDFWFATRILLRSMGSRPEANSYGFCATVWLAALCEVQSVIIPAQLAFTVTGIYFIYFESSLHELPNLYLMYEVILNMDQFALALCTWCLCYTTEQEGLQVKLVLGSRVPVEVRSQRWVYMWTLLIVNIIMIVVGRWRFSMLLLWLLPLTVVVYAAAYHGIPPLLLSPVVACPPHTGPAMAMVGLAVTLAYLAYIVLVRGCFLLPCLCAPTVPGWLFLPTADPPDFDWADVGNFDWDLGWLVVRKLLGYEPLFPEDCQWEPPPCDPHPCRPLPAAASRRWRGSRFNHNVPGLVTVGGTPYD